MTYDASGNQLTNFSENDDDGDGNIDSAYRQTYTYDENGVRTSRLSESDDDGDGVFENSEYTEYEFSTIADGLYYLLMYYWD